MKKSRKNRRTADHVIGKCLLVSLLGMVVYVTGNLEGQASVRYAEPAPVTLWKNKPASEKKVAAPKQQAKTLTVKEYQIALAECGDDWVCAAHLDYQRKQRRSK
jgi:hypothetical protein